MSSGRRNGTASDYVERRDGGYWVRDTRVSLDSIVYAFKRGAAPESIQRSFSLLTLEQIYGAIAFYLAHQQEIDAFLDRSEQELASQATELNRTARESNPKLFERLKSARRERTTP
jgi:uncharacterized protein (DUF433 family)